MKATVFTFAFLLSSLALANDTCLKDAKLQARIFSAQENGTGVSKVRVTDSFFHSEESGVLYYGIEVNKFENINVGLDKETCALVEINYVTDEYD
ncbi:hypothetical protein ACES2L_07505 [Bdellovibrio bacteriovorus]